MCWKAVGITFRVHKVFRLYSWPLWLQLKLKIDCNHFLLIIPGSHISEESSDVCQVLPAPFLWGHERPYVATCWMRSNSDPSCPKVLNLPLNVWEICYSIFITIPSQFGTGTPEVQLELFLVQKILILDSTPLCLNKVLKGGRHAACSWWSWTACLR